MASPRCMGCLICLALLFSSLRCQTTDGNNMTPQLQLNGTCACRDQEGKIYNLTKLGRTDGKPRFNATASDKYKFSYNPCYSFTLGSFGGCFGDIAICMWTETSFQNIGKQSKVICDLDKDGTPQLVYRSDSPGWSAIVNLKCDPKKTSIESAKFEVKADDFSWKFLLTHSCACPDGCPEHPPTTKPSSEPTIPTGPSVKPTPQTGPSVTPTPQTGPSVTPTPQTGPSGTPKPHGQDVWENIGVPVCIAAAALVFVIMSVLVIWRLITRDNRRNDERQHLVDDERFNNDLDEGRRSGSLPRPMSRSDDVTFDKTFNTGNGSAPV